MLKLKIKQNASIFVIR